jgi:hypothetical protein
MRERAGRAYRAGVGSFIASAWAGIVLVWDFVPPLQWIHRKVSERNLQVENAKPPSVYWLPLQPIGHQLVARAWVRVTNHSQTNTCRIIAATAVVRHRVCRWWWRTHADFPMDIRIPDRDRGQVTNNVQIGPVDLPVEMELDVSADLGFPVTFTGAVFYRLTLVGSPRRVERKLEAFEHDAVTKV